MEHGGNRSKLAQVWSMVAVGGTAAQVWSMVEVGGNAAQVWSRVSTGAKPLRGGAWLPLGKAAPGMGHGCHGVLLLKGGGHVYQAMLLRGGPWRLINGVPNVGS